MALCARRVHTYPRSPRRWRSLPSLLRLKNQRGPARTKLPPTQASKQECTGPRDRYVYAVFKYRTCTSDVLVFFITPKVPTPRFCFIGQVASLLRENAGAKTEAGLRAGDLQQRLSAAQEELAREREAFAERKVRVGGWCGGQGLCEWVLCRWVFWCFLLCLCVLVGGEGVCCGVKGCWWFLLHSAYCLAGGIGVLCVKECWRFCGAFAY